VKIAENQYYDDLCRFWICQDYPAIFYGLFDM
jgi:hypothetical protein